MQSIICMSRQGDRPAPSEPKPVGQLAKLWRQLGAAGPPLPSDVTAADLRATIADELRLLLQPAYRLGLHRSATLEGQCRRSETLDADELASSQHEVVLRTHSEVCRLPRTPLGVTPLLVERGSGFALTAADLVLGLLLAKAEIEVTAGCGLGATVVVACLANGRRVVASVRANEPIVVGEPRQIGHERVHHLDEASARDLGLKFSTLIEAPFDDAFGLQVLKDLRCICADLRNLERHAVLGLPFEEYLDVVLPLYPSLRTVEYHAIWGRDAVARWRRRSPA